MAKGTSAIGKFRGKMGSVVYRVVDGSQVMQEYNSNPAKSRTDPQLCQRMGMRLISRIGSALLAAIHLGFSTKSYPFSQFVKANLKPSVVTGNTPGAVTVNYPNIVLAEDTLHHNTMIVAGTPDFGETEHLKVSIPIELYTDLLPADLKTCVALYCPDLGLALLDDTQTGAVQQATVQVPNNWDGQEVHAWVFARADVGTIDPDAVNQSSARLPYLTSASVYAGFGEIQ